MRADHTRCRSGSRRIACQTVAAWPNWNLALGEVPLSCPYHLGWMVRCVVRRSLSAQLGKNGQCMTTEAPWHTTRRARMVFACRWLADAGKGHSRSLATQRACAEGHADYVRGDSPSRRRALHSVSEPLAPSALSNPGRSLPAFRAADPSIGRGPQKPGRYRNVAHRRRRSLNLIGLDSGVILRDGSSYFHSHWRGLLVVIDGCIA